MNLAASRPHRFTIAYHFDRNNSDESGKSINVGEWAADGEYETLTIDCAKLTNQPLLGLATTAELLSELQARADVGGYASYRTVDSN